MLDKPRHTPIEPVTESLTLSDGVQLVADIYRPAEQGDYPVLLMRQPYGRKIASTVTLAHPAWYAAHGYIVVVQDVRGMGGSQGDFDCLRQEVRDGAETVEWARAITGSNGKIGLYGFSYQAVTQYLALAGGARVDAMAPAMASFSPEHDWAYEGGALRFGGMTFWARQMALLKAAHKGDRASWDMLAALTDPATIYRALLARPDLSHLALWAENSADYWETASPARLLKDIDLAIPVLHTGGFADFMLTGTLAADKAFRKASAATTHLIIGPWSHIPWNASAGEAHLPGTAARAIDRDQIAFFDFYLKGLGEAPPAASLYDMGTNAWRDFADFPTGETRSLDLTSGGLAATHLGDGRLGEAEKDGGFDLIVSDPFRPAPLVGGHLGDPAGPVDRAAHDSRSDVATYTTAAAENPFTLCGPLTAEITVKTAEPVFDLVASLSLVSPSGVARVIATGTTRISVSDRPVKIDLRSIYQTVAKGNCLRLSLQIAAWSAFSYPGEDPADADPMARQPATLAILHGGATASRLYLHVMTEDHANGA
ncbi:CocE/NonD family hydrolase [Martelella alba]|uniref:CocE/NonD family hydrolase n=1 Tax=Martelella alba TaxID=2590451 RepID=A0A506UFB4_9HYPH|nr:CocE/NonD family hydrolase [Martelella alba]TPW30497.1 CocE/NonD family hydrolase [Martelella alba]